MRLKIDAERAFWRRIYFADEELRKNLQVHYYSIFKKFSISKLKFENLFKMLKVTFD